MVDDDDGDVVDIFVNNVDMVDVDDEVDDVFVIGVAVVDTDKGVIVLVAAAFVHNVDDTAVVRPVSSKLLVETSV